MDVVTARGTAYNEAAAYSPRSPSEDDITNIPLESLASPASTSSLDGSLSTSSEYGAEPAAFPDQAAPFDFVASSFVPPALSANSQASQECVHDPAAVPTFYHNALPSPSGFLSMQAGPSDGYVPTQAHVPNVMGEATNNGDFGLSSHDGLLHELWPHGNIEWANPPLGSPSESNTTQSFASPAPQMQPWDGDLPPLRHPQDCTLPSLASMGLLEPSFYGSEIGQQTSAYEPEGAPRTMLSDAGPTAIEWREPHGLQSRMFEAMTRLQAVPCTVELPSCQPEPECETSWSSEMSECSVVV